MSRNPPTATTVKGDQFARALAACMIAHQRASIADGRSSPERELEKLGASHLAHEILRAVQLPASTFDPDWTSPLTLSENLVLDFVSSLPNASARLFQLAGIKADLYPKTRFVQRKSDFIQQYAWVGELAPIPVGSIEFANGETFTPGKLAMISVLTRELSEQSDAESQFATLLTEDAVQALDLHMLGTEAGTADNPPGLLNGVTAIPGSADARADLGALYDAVPKLQKPALLVTARRLLSIDMQQFRATDGRLGGAEIVLTSEQADDMVTLMDAQDLAVAGAPLPVIESARDGAVVMTSPGLPFTDAAGVMGQPILSLMQQDLIALKSRLQVSWAWRRDGRVARLEGCTW